MGAKVIAASGVSGLGITISGGRGQSVPPPQIQLEEVNEQARINKEAESGDPEE
jgi:hypothetical protein